MEDSTETLPAHIAELQKLREACGGLCVDITDAHFSGVISLSMLTPSWDPKIGTLGGVLDPKVVLMPQHQVEQETRTHHLQQRPTVGIPGWHPTEMREL